MTRETDIKKKISYAENRRQTLMDDMFRAKKENVEPEFIAQTAGEILSTVRECYDYCAQDIMEKEIIPHTGNSKLAQDYQSGKLHVYFPYYKNQLTKNLIFKELKKTNKALHSHLFSLSAKIEKNKIMDGTRFQYGDIVILQDMVNQKKHDQLFGIETNDDQEIIVEKDGMQMIFPIKEQVGVNKIVIGPGQKAMRVAEFRFEFNDAEVGKFCMSTTKITERVLEQIYTTYFNCSII